MGAADALFRPMQVSTRVQSNNRVHGNNEDMFDPSKIKGRQTNIELPASLETGKVGIFDELVIQAIDY